MTTHYGKEVTAEQVMDGYVHYKLSGCYAVMSYGDTVAYACWNYLDSLECEEADTPVVEEWFVLWPDPEKTEATTILKAVVELHNKDE